MMGCLQSRLWKGGGESETLIRQVVASAYGVELKKVGSNIKERVGTGERTSMSYGRWDDRRRRVGETISAEKKERRTWKKHTDRHSFFQIADGEQISRRLLIQLPSPPKGSDFEEERPF